MDKLTIAFSLLLASLLLHGSFTHGLSGIQEERKAYIVYMGDIAAKAHVSAVDRHHDLLSSVIGDEEIARQSRIYSYWKSFDAFAAHLSSDEVVRLEENENVVSVFPSTVRKLHTTRSWDFVGMPVSVYRKLKKESDIIIGMLDTGIYIDAPSFNDKGLGPPPSRWKGSCQLGGNFTRCNNKVIGAKSYDMNPKMSRPDQSPADEIGHGTHTSSTAAGVTVQGANLYGLGKGVARGGVPSARIAMYKVCHEDGCGDIDILAAFDDAIHDGVDLISASIGGPTGPYIVDTIAIGSFHAMRKGILTSCSAGNDGPIMGSVENVAPWILTVGATGTDRQFKATVGIGNGKKISGASINTFAANGKMNPLVTAKQASINNEIDSYLDKSKVKGKILLCRGGDDTAIKELGGVGMILVVGANLDTGFAAVVPSTHVDDKTADDIEKYINSTKNPQAIIFKSKAVKVTAPFVASFSARGPNTVSYTILKPDIVAPGIDILAAFSKLVSVTGSEGDSRYDVYNIISGTSMSCPHATGAAAYVKSFHPYWSPAAIKSALMTTASEIKVKDELAELAYGAGQIDPVKAVYPGLIYDVSETDYVSFLCNEGYTESMLSMIAGKQVNCKKAPKFGGYDDINYPSMHIFQENSTSSISAVFRRTVTNVGHANSTYKATVKAPKGVKITVKPDTLVFTKGYQKKYFQITVKGKANKSDVILSGSLEWRDSKHTVRSPIVIFIMPKLT